MITINNLIRRVNSLFHKVILLEQASGTGPALATVATTGSYTDLINKPSIPSVTGSNTGDETASTIKTKLGITTLSGSNTGDQDISGKVDKVAGKGLSTEDYTTTEKTKLAAISGTNTGDQSLVLYGKRVAVDYTQRSISTVNEQTVITVVIPAGSFTSTSSLIFNWYTSTDGTNGTKIFKIKLNGTVVWSISQTTSTPKQTMIYAKMHNRNSLSSQVMSSNINGFNTSSATPATYAIDTSAAVTLTCTLQTATAGEVISSEAFDAVIIG